MKSDSNELVKEFSKLKSEKEIRDFLSGLLTPNEIREFAQRIKIIKKLKKKTPHHTIAQELGVGVATVTRGANELKKGRFSSI